MRLPRIPALAPAVALLALALGLAACGEKSEDASTAAQPLSLTLDFYPNADHAGIYMAQKLGYFEEAGLDVSIETPADPAAPLKLVAAGESDLAISYEPEVALAHEKGLDVVAIAALVNRPLTSLIWLRKSGIKGVADLKGKTVATAGIPYQDAFLETILARAQLSPERRQGGQRRLRPAAGADRRQRRGDARRLQQRRGGRPARARQRPGDHPGRPARRAHLRRAGAGRQPLQPRSRPGKVPPLHRRPAARHRRRGGAAGARRPKPCSRPTTTSTRS